MSTLQNQVKLPLAVALEVVLQGIRIRLGRSVVTITGVVCGIAFLMSILTGQLIKRGVVAEDATRSEVDRMLNFIRADLPSLDGKPIALITAGPLSEVEMRLLEALAAAGVSRVATESADAAPLPRPLPIPVVTGPEALAEAAVLFYMGQGHAPARDWAAQVGARPLATTVATDRLPPLPAAQLVPLARTVGQEELAKLAAARQAEKFRGIWIGIISLLVTVIGIANAMLMSVTERFREIGTMKCLGSLSSFIRQIFLLESSIMGLTGGLAGALLGMAFSFLAYACTYGFALVLQALALLPLLGFAVLAVAAGVILSVVAALYPAQVASKMVPAHALRSNV